MGQFIQFTKIDGAGNGFIFLDATREVPTFSLPELARAITNPHFGMGADGLVLISRSQDATARIDLYTPEGEKARFYGNSLRCAALFIRMIGLSDSKFMTVESPVGLHRITIDSYTGLNAVVTVDMRRPDFNATTLPPTRDEFGRVIMSAGENAFTIFPVSMGAPHGVVFTDDFSDSFFNTHAPLLSKNSRWPYIASIEFARKLGSGIYEGRIWEENIGETLASGTGACAIAAAAWLRGEKDPVVSIRLKGGTLSVTRDTDSGNFLLTGETALIGQGEFLFQ